MNLFIYELLMLLWLGALVQHGNKYPQTLAIFLITGTIFFYFWQYKEKWLWLKIWAIFSLILIFCENYVVKSTGALTYNNTRIFGLVPHWLLYAYANMVLLILMIYQYYKGQFV